MKWRKELKTEMAHNEEKLVKLLKYVSKNNDYYKKIIKDNKIENPEDIRQYPLLSRDSLSKNIAQMISSRYKDDYVANRLKCVVTSGSTGRPLKSYISHDDYIKTMIPLWRLRKKHYGISASSRVVRFYSNTIGFDNKTKYYINSNEMQVYVANLFNYNDYIEIAQSILLFLPNWFYIQPSMLEKLMDVYENGDSIVPESLSYIESVGEILFENIRNRAERLFNISIANMYGAEEINSIAFECPFGNMHILTENVLVECMNNSGDILSNGKGNIIITDLTNYTTPKIRYYLGDLVLINDRNCMCPCGSSEPVIESIIGRENECFVLKNGVEITSSALNGCIIELNNLLENPIDTYEFNYNTNLGILICKLEIRDSFKLWVDEVVKELTSLIKNKYDVKVKILTNFQPAQGKRRYLIKE